MTNTDIKTATADLADDKVKGLDLRVFSGGKSKIFYLRYRFNGIQRRPKIGDWPTVNLFQAREIAKTWLGQVAAGVDPSAERQKARAGEIVKDLCKTYMTEHGDGKKTGDEDQRMIDRYINPAFGNEKTAAIDEGHVERLRIKMKTVPIQFNRVLSLLSKMFNLAEKWKLRPRGTNPCKFVERYPERKRKRYATREESIAIFERLRGYHNQYPEQVMFLWLLIYTGARPIEIAAAEWQHLHGDKIVLSEHKTEGTGDDRQIHLPPQALALIGAPRETGPIVGIKNPRHLWTKIKADTKIKNLRIYDLRHSFASIGLSHGMSLDELGELMGHRSKQTTSRYAHLIDEHAQTAVTKVADAFDAFAKPRLAVVK
jgi:integrase